MQLDPMFCDRSRETGGRLLRAQPAHARPVLQAAAPLARVLRDGRQPALALARGGRALLAAAALELLAAVEQVLERVLAGHRVRVPRPEQPDLGKIIMKEESRRRKEKKEKKEEEEERRDHTAIATS